MTMDRRTLLKGAAVAGAGVAVSTTKSVEASERVTAPPDAVNDKQPDALTTDCLVVFFPGLYQFELQSEQLLLLQRQRPVQVGPLRR